MSAFIHILSTLRFYSFHHSLYLAIVLAGAVFLWDTLSLLHSLFICLHVFLSYYIYSYNFQNLKQHQNPLPIKIERTNGEEVCTTEKETADREGCVCVCVLFIVQLVEKAGDKSWGMRHYVSLYLRCWAKIMYMNFSSKLKLTIRWLFVIRGCRVSAISRLHLKDSIRFTPLFYIFLCYSSHLQQKQKNESEKSKKKKTKN